MTVLLVTVADDRAGRKEGKYADTQNAVLEFLQRQSFGIDRYAFWKWPDIAATDFYRQNQAMLDHLDADMNGRCYKPYVILEGLKSLQDGDFLIYNDVSPNIWAAYLQKGVIDSGVYDIAVIKKLCTDNGGILSTCVRLTLPGNSISPADIFDHTHENFTLEHCINRMGMQAYKHSLQHASGMMVLQKSQKTLDFVSEWLQWNLIDECASLGSVPANRNEPGPARAYIVLPPQYNFWNEEVQKGYGKLGHRHDQSISGLLLNRMGHKLVRETEEFCFLGFCKKYKTYEFIDSNQPPTPYKLKMRHGTTDGTDGVIDRVPR